MNDSKPNLFIVGAAKAGTTSIYHYLKAHPEIYMSPIKEPNFFGKDIRWENFEPRYQRNTFLDNDTYFSKEKLEERHIAFLEDMDAYSKLFENGIDSKYRGEASTSYLYSTTAAQEIYTFNPQAKIIIILREPVDRALSHYFMDLSGTGQNEQDVLKGLQEDYQVTEKGWGISHLYIELSLYYDQVKRYLDCFPRNQICILYYDQLKNDSEKIKDGIYEFLGVPTLGKTPGLQKSYNNTQIPKTRLIKQMLGLKKYLPRTVIHALKQRVSFLFKERKDVKVPREAIRFVANLVHEDWEKTQDLLLK